MKTFETKLRSMTAKQIIQAMIDGLNNEWVKIDMETFGYIGNGICFGCAATNTICEIQKETFSSEKNEIRTTFGRAEFANANSYFMDNFEEAINSLRIGDIWRCNRYLRQGDIATIKNPNFIDLPTLNTFNWKENIHYYQQLADDQE